MKIAKMVSWFLNLKYTNFMVNNFLITKRRMKFISHQMIESNTFCRIINMYFLKEQ